MLNILQISDLHLLPDPEGTLMGVNTENNFRRVLEHAFTQHDDIDLILLTGDLAQDPTEATYQRIYTILSDYATPTLCLPGNHDDALLLRRILNQTPVSSEKIWSTDHWQLICLDSQIPGSQAGRLTPKELDFLQQQLNAAPQRPTLIAIHHHCLPTECAWMDTMIIENNDAFLALLTQHPQVKLVLCGHIHQTMNKRHRDIAILGTPASCFQFKAHSPQFAIDALPPGYRLLNLHADGHFETKVYWLDKQDPGLDFSLTGY